MRHPNPSTDAIFEGYLVDLGRIKILDLTPVKVPEMDKSTAMHLIRGHSFLRFEHHGDMIRYSMTDAEKLRENLDRGTMDMPYRWLDDRLILTGDTEQLQAFVLSIPELVWSEWEMLHRLGKTVTVDE